MRDVILAVTIGLVFAVPPSLAAWFAYQILAAVRTPSGDPLGSVAERTHELAAVNRGHLVQQTRKWQDGGLDDMHKLVNDCYEQTQAVLALLEAERKNRH